MTELRIASPFVSEIVRCRLLAAAEDMRLALIRSAYSSILYEIEDCAVAVLDRNADVLGQSSGLPMFLGNLEQAVKEGVRLRGGESQLLPGDVICLNDSYIQGTHLEDATVFSPIFWQGDLVGYAVARAHLEDLGGRDPGGGFTTTEIYQEGLRLGPVKLVSAGEINSDLLDIVRRNSRFGDQVVGDLHAMIAACRTGERRLCAVLDRFGLDTFLVVRDELFRQSEEIDRATVGALANGTYVAEGFLDDDGVDLGKPVRIRVTITVSGESLHVDFAGTSAAVSGALNCGVAQAISSVRVAYFMLLGGDRTPDGGSFRNLSVTVPEGTFLNAQEPSACEAYASSSVLLMDLIVSALAPVLPARVCAGQFGDALTRVTGTDPTTGKLFMLGEAHAGGWGAASNHDGADGVIDLTNGRLRNRPIELLETKYPIRVLEYGYRPDSGGAGEFRGGCGIIRRYHFCSDVEIYYWLDRNVTPAWGLFGGMPGKTSEARIIGSLGETRPLKVHQQPLKAGDELVILTGGGGGYGDPQSRASELLSKDVERGLVSPAGAADEYRDGRKGFSPLAEAETQETAARASAAVAKDRTCLETA